MAKPIKDNSGNKQRLKGPHKGHVTKRQIKQAKYKRGMGSIAEGNTLYDFNLVDNFQQPNKTTTKK